MVTMETSNLTEYILVEYRWVIVLTVLLPLSFLWKIYSYVRNNVVFALASAPKMHDSRVKQVQKQIKTWVAGKRDTKLCTARPTWQTMSFRQGMYKKFFTNIRVDLVDILEVDTKNMTVRCEPLVTMGQLSSTLKKLGLALAIVPELDQLTVGGLVMGTGIETSSHVHGLFQHICLQYELVLADGSVVTCSKDDNADLFYAVPWSYGTLGFLTSVVLKIVPAKKYVRLEYHPYSTLKELSARFSAESLKPNPHQFVEALLFTRENGVVMVGDMTDEIGSDGKLNPIGKWYSRWFFTQVHDHMVAGVKKVEYIPLRDYYHRHTRSLFWELQDIISFGNQPLFRYLFGWLMPPEVSLLKLTQPDAVKQLYERAHVIQDMLVPVDKLESAIQVFHEEFQVYPIWLCPFKLFNLPGQLKVHSGDWQMFVDIGVYGVPKAKGYVTEPSTRRVESFVMKNHGFQMLYADTYTTREEFRRMFDHTLYDSVREKMLHCKEAFPEIYGKINKSLNPIGKWYSRWFFTQVHDHMVAGVKKVEYIPLRDYYHRHTRSLFWELQDIISFGNQPLFRYLFGWLMPPEVSLLKLTQPDAVKQLYERAHVIQDMLVPVDKLESAIQVFHEEFQVYPIWLCPFKLFNLPGQLKVHSGDWQMFVDIGVYGVPKAKGYVTEPSTRRVESFVMKNHGFQMLYADTYTTREEFRRMFDHTLYDSVREKMLHCKEAFPEIYGKINKSLNPIGKWYSRWFFTQVHDHMVAGVKKVEYIPLRDYYHRHTRSLFWELQDIISFGNQPLFRYLFGWLMPPEVSLLKLTQPDAVKQLYERAHVIQDMLVPVDKLESAIQVFHEEFQVYPIWLCPFKLFNLPGQLKVHSGDWQMFVDIGVYGVPKAKGYVTEPSTRRVESFVMKNHGFQMLYADTYTTREEFRRMFDHTLYDSVREKMLHCKEAFPEIYGKINKSVRK